MTADAKGKLCVGWREWVSLPDLGVKAIKVKVNTGARTSALHAEYVRYVRRGGKRMVRFVVNPVQRSVHGQVEALAPLVGKRHIKSSSGHIEERPVIRTRMQLDGDLFDIELTLTSRDQMGFRMLVGRQAIRGHAVVDPGRSYLTEQSRKVRRKKRRERAARKAAEGE